MVAALDLESEIHLREHRQHSTRDFVGADGFHAAEIDWTFAEKTGAAFDMMSQNNVPVAEWSGQARFGRAENGDHRHAE